MLPLLAAMTMGQCAVAQETFPVNGVVNKQLVRTALEHATVHVSSTEVIEDATVVFYQGRIEAVGAAGEAEGHVVEGRLGRQGLRCDVGVGAGSEAEHVEGRTRDRDRGGVMELETARPHVREGGIGRRERS